MLVIIVDTHGLTPVALVILKDFNFHLWHSTTDLRPWSSAVFDKGGRHKGMNYGLKLINSLFACSKKGSFCVTTVWKKPA